MTYDNALKWAYGWLAALSVFAALWLSLQMPLPASVPICFGIGAAFGAIMIGPIVYIALRRF